MKIGFMGLNHFGNLLIQSFLQAQTFLPTEVMVYDRNMEKADTITSKYPGSFAARHSWELIQEVTCFFLCIDEYDYQPLKEEIQDKIKSSQVLISLIPSIKLDKLEMDFPCKVAKIQLDSEDLNFNSFTIGSRITHDEKQMLQQLFSTIDSSKQNTTLFLS